VSVTARSLSLTHAVLYTYNAVNHADRLHPQEVNRFHRLSQLLEFFTLIVFTVRLHVMQRTVLLSQFCPSVRLSVCMSDCQMRVL